MNFFLIESKNHKNYHIVLNHFHLNLCKGSRGVHFVVLVPIYRSEVRGAQMSCIPRTYHIYIVFITSPLNYERWIDVRDIPMSL